MTWQFDVSNMGGSQGAQYGTFRLKEHLKSVGWTVALSGDAGGNSGAADYWVAEPMPDFAWVVMQHPQYPTIPLQIVFHIQSNPNSMYWFFSPSGTFSGGTDTVRATAPDEVTGWGSGNNFSSLSGVLVLGADDAAPYGFYMSGWEDNFGGAYHTTIFDPLTSTDPSDNHEYIFVAGEDNTITDSLLGTESTNVGTTRCVGTIGNGAFSGTIPALSYCAAGGGIVVSPGNNEPRSPYTNNETLWPIAFARRFGLTGEGYKGMSTVMKWGGGRQGDYGNTFSGPGGDRIIFGDINLPWDGSVPPNIL